MGSVFIPLYKYDVKQDSWRKYAWIGPEETLKPEPRKSLNSRSKREILSRQKNRCRSCESKISLEPYCNADADHIIPISYGGKTTLENMQLLCVGCHRHKTSLENSREKRVIHLSKSRVNPGETLVVYSSRPDISRPVDMRNPLDLPTDDPGTPYVLSYKKRRRGFQFEEDTANIFDQFRYQG